MSRRIAIRGATLAVEQRGAGVPLLWCHGFTSSRAHEDQMGLLRWDALQEVSRVVRYDARGHGDSSATKDEADYGWDRLALDMLELASALDAPRFVAGGVSMGAATSLHAAVAAPERVAGLVLAAPPTAWQTRRAQASIYEGGADLVETQGLDAFLAEAAKQPPPPIFADLAERVVLEPQIAEADLPTVMRGAAASDLPPLEALAALDMPALILAWADDPGHPLATAEALAHTLPNARLHVARKLADLGAWNGHIAGFLEGIDP